MTVAEASHAGREHLAASGIDEAGITAEVLLRHVLNLNRTELYLAWDRPIAPEAWARYQAHLADRVRGRPVAYIVGHREFMGLDFLVDERVLIPRPETEVLVAAVLDAVVDVPSPVIADVGTGSGAIAVSIAVLRSDATVLATDITAEALEVARTNAARHGVADRVRFLQGDLLEPVAEWATATLATAEATQAGLRLDVLACNPPYVTAEVAASLPVEIRDFEPAVAVLAQGSADRFHGLLIEGAPALLHPGGWIIMEVSAGQAPRVVELVRRAGVYEAEQTRRDGLGSDRIVAARLKSAP
ncbi:MAG: peptide chain release factor N(5)-glutamine methyltransferase [bacterium]